MASATPTQQQCLNCGEGVTGAYCAHCGQPAGPPVPSMKDVVRDFCDEAIGIDSKFLRTCKTLLLKPGQLTKDYVSGKKACYVAPFKLYLVASAIFFMVFGLFQQDQLLASYRELSEATQEATKPMAVTPEQKAALESQLTPDQKRQIKMVGAVFKAFEFYIQNMAAIYILLIPFNTLVLAVVYFKRRRLLLEHLIFTVHVWSASFVFVIVLIPFWLMPRNTLLEGVVFMVYSLALAIYQVKSTRTFYGGSVLEATFKTVLSFVFTMIASMLVLFAILFWFVRYGPG